MAKIQMKTPLVEMDGDEMTRILWKWIKEILLEPYIDLNTEYYDLGLEYREKQRIRLLSTVPKQLKNTELPLNVQQLLRMPQECLNIT